MSTVHFFKHPIRLHALVLAGVELLVSMGSVYAASYVRFSANTQAISESVGWVFPRAIGYAVVLLISMIAMGLYQHQLRVGIVGFGIRLSTSYLFAGVVLAIIFYVFPGLYLGRGVIFFALIISTLGIMVVRFIFSDPSVKNALRTKILILGAGEKANLVSTVHRPVIGFVPVDGEAQVVAADRLVKPDRALPDFATDNAIDEIVVAVDDRRNNFPLHELLECRMRGIAVIDELTFFERESGKIRLDMLQPSWIVFSMGFQSNGLRRHSKRLFDILASLFVLGITWPIMALTGLAIVVESGWKGPILYRQLRVGEAGKQFMLLKFRSMCVDAEKDGRARWAQHNDSRVTRVGAVIRKYRIDELPQIVNILSGEMSIIGPRPERPEFVNDLTERIPYYGERHRIKPGLSGWAQLCYPYGASENDAVEKLQYDLYYVKNHSLFLDISILLQTVEVVCFGQGAR